MAPTLLEIDPQFLESIGTVMGAASRQDDPLDGRVRILIAMALDLAAGSAEGTTSMSALARGFGVTDEQIADVVKVCCATAALQRVAIGSVALTVDGGAPSGALGAFGSLLDDSDSEFRSAAERVVSAAFGADSDADGRLALKDRYLVALALETAFGSEVGVGRRAELCRTAGANDGEVTSTPSAPRNPRPSWSSRRLPTCQVSWLIVTPGGVGMRMSVTPLGNRASAWWSVP